MSSPGSASALDTSARGLRYQLIPDLNWLDGFTWDSLLSDANFFNSRGWLAGLEQAIGKTDLLTVTGPTGLLGGLPVWRGEQTPGLFCLADLFRPLAGPWQTPLLWLGARRSTHNQVPCTTGPQRRAVLSRLMDASLAMAEDRGLAGIIMPYMPLAHAHEWVESSGQGQVVLHSAEGNLSIPTGGFEALLASLTTRDRHTIRAEIGAFRRCGGRVTWSKLTQEMIRPVATLIAQNRQRHGGDQGEEWMQNMLRGQQRCGTTRVIHIAQAHFRDDLAATTLFYRFGNALHARYFGSDYSRTTRDFRYFILSYYAPLDYGADIGVAQLHLSISALHAKAKRGARIDPLAAVIAGRAMPEQEAVTAHNARFTQQMKHEYDHHLSQEWHLADH